MYSRATAIFSLLFPLFACGDSPPASDGAVPTQQAGANANTGGAWRPAPAPPSSPAGQPSTPGQPGAAPVVTAPTPSAPPPAAPPATPSPTPSAACASLRSCCSGLTQADARQLCQAISEDSEASVCMLGTAMFCAPATPPAVPGAPITPGVPTTPVGDPCTELLACCATLEDDEDIEECEAAAADSSSCATSVADFCPDATTPTTPPSSGDACLDLLGCCATLEDDEDIEDCEATAADADPVACGEATTELCAAGGGDD
ncbi:MAG: hypothetical protein ABW321_12540 [Polyangiales bacterium]